jgi:cell wall-associated NlpC family hydrolase
MKNHLPFINVYEKKNLKSKISTQLLYGETFKKIKKTGSWIKIKNKIDGYNGYIKNKNFLKNSINTHKVFRISANLYSKPNVKNKIKKKLSFGSRIKVLEKKGSFYKFDNLWLKKIDLKNDSYQSNNIFKNIKKFINIKYKWGGKYCTGIDCSALVQLPLNFNNKFCPRDTKDQIKFFKKKN